MKRWIALLTALLLLFLTACSTSTDSDPEEQAEVPPAVESEETPSAPDPGLSEEQEEEANPEDAEKPEETPPEAPEETPEEPEPTGGFTAYDGTYRLTEQTDENEETYLVVRGFPDFLILETYVVYEGSTYSFWVEEFWPDGDVTLGDAAITGKSQTYSIMTKGHIYNEMPMERKVTRTSEGISLQLAGEDPVEYVRDDSYSYHTSEEELVARLNEMFTLEEAPSELVGVWSFWDGLRYVYLELQEDGGFHLISKDPGMPVFLFDGAWGVDADTGDIQITAELVGDGQYPYHVSWQWQLEDSQCLYLVEEDEYILQRMNGDYLFFRAEENEPLPMTQDTAMGYVWNEYDQSGAYTDQYGTEYFYYYRLPQFFEDNDDLREINTEIREKYVPIIEDELAAMRQNEFITAQNVDYSLMENEDILTLYIRSFSWEWEAHDAWYYDLRTNSRTDSRELLRRLNIDEEEFLDAVRMAAEVCFVETFGALSEEERDAYGYYDFLEWTLSDEAINFDLPIFADAVGNLCVMGRIGSMAGASEFWAPLYPFDDFSGFEGAVG